LEEDFFNEEVIPSGKQLSNRRSYLRMKMFQDLSQNTEGGFYRWLNDNNVEFSQANPNDFMVLSHSITSDDFILIVSTKSLLNNVVKENKELYGFLACNTTHKLISCQLKLTTVATSTIDREIADVAYIIHAHENTETFIYSLKEIQKALKKYYDHDWKVQVSFLKFGYLFYFSSYYYY